MTAQPRVTVLIEHGDGRVTKYTGHYADHVQDPGFPGQGIVSVLAERWERVDLADSRLTSEVHDDQWAVFHGDPDDAEDIVSVFDEMTDAEELAQRVIDSHIGHRRRTISEPAWRILPRCSGCGSVLDGDLCCDGRRAEIEAGDAVLMLPVLDHLHDIDAGGNCRDPQCGFNSDVEAYR